MTKLLMRLEIGPAAAAIGWVRLIDRDQATMAVRSLRAHWPPTAGSARLKLDIPPPIRARSIYYPVTICVLECRGFDVQVSQCQMELPILSSAKFSASTNYSIRLTAGPPAVYANRRLHPHPPAHQQCRGRRGGPPSGSPPLRPRQIRRNRAGFLGRQPMERFFLATQIEEQLSLSSWRRPQYASCEEYIRAFQLDPVHREGHQPNFFCRIEPLNRFHQANIALLNQVCLCQSIS